MNCCPCYEQIMNPSFFHGEGDCETNNSDVRIVSGDLSSGSDVQSAALIQFGTDARFNGQRGWWGEEFMGFPIGNELWSIQQQGITALKTDELVRKAVQPLIDQGLADDARVEAVKTMQGVSVELELTQRGDGIFTVEL